MGKGHVLRVAQPSLWALLCTAACDIDVNSPGKLGAEPALHVELIDTNDCAALGDRWVGYMLDCVFDLHFTVQGDKFPDTTGYNVSTYPTSGWFSDVPLVDGAATVRIDPYGPYGNWRATSEVDFVIRDAADQIVEFNEYLLEGANPTLPGSTPVFVWGAYWKRGWLRVAADYSSEVPCDDDIRIVVFVGGDLSRIERVDITVTNENTGQPSSTIDDASLPVVAGQRRYDFSPQGLCNSEGTGNTVDPTFYVTLRGPTGIVGGFQGYAIDTDD